MLDELAGAARPSAGATAAAVPDAIQQVSEVLQHPLVSKWLENEMAGRRLTRVRCNTLACSQLEVLCICICVSSPVLLDLHRCTWLAPPSSISVISSGMQMLVSCPWLPWLHTQVVSVGYTALSLHIAAPIPSPVTSCLSAAGSALWNMLLCSYPVCWMLLLLLV